MVRYFLADRRGSVSVMAGLCFTLLVAAAGLIVHASQFYVVKLREQRAADLATLAAANIATPIAKGQPTQDAIETAANVLELNGFTGAVMNVSAVNSGTQLRVALSKTQPLIFGSNNSAKSATIISASISSTAKQAPACIMSLSGEIVVASSGTVSSYECGLAASTYLKVTGGTVFLKGIGVGVTQQTEAPYLRGAAALTPPANQMQYSYAVVDPIANTAGIAALDAKLAAMSGGWPFGTTTPPNIQTPSFNGGDDLEILATVQTVAQSAFIRNLTVRGSTANFAGSGWADPLCQNATIITGTTRIKAGSTLNLGLGCYVFQGDFILDDGSYPAMVLPGTSSVRMVFLGNIINNTGSVLRFTSGAYQISGVQNNGGGQILFGDGTKAITGLVKTDLGLIDLGNGPFYINNGTVSANGGTINFGNGMYYLHYANIINAGTINFKSQLPMVAYGSTIWSNVTGNAPATFNFSVSALSLGRSSLKLGRNATMNFMTSAIDLYNSTWEISGGTLNIGDASTMNSGSATIAMTSSSLKHTGGNITARGVTFAAKESSVAFGDGQLLLTAPRNAAPAKSYQDLLFYSPDQGVQFASNNQFNEFSGVIYTPSGRTSFSYGFYPNMGNGCFSVVGGSVSVDRNAYVLPKACSNFNFPTVISSRSFLKS